MRKSTAKKDRIDRSKFFLYFSFCISIQNYFGLEGATDLLKTRQNISLFSDFFVSHYLCEKNFFRRFYDYGIALRFSLNYATGSAKKIFLANFTAKSFVVFSHAKNDSAIFFTPGG